MISFDRLPWILTDHVELVRIWLPAVNLAGSLRLSLSLIDDGAEKSTSRRLLHLPRQQKMRVSYGKSDGNALC